ncbi:MAG: hypothetical protein IKK95_08740 [Lachnospiraceae bacterium]|nr:hypothetical protein [Lachnospiraceae bacterium]
MNRLYERGWRPWLAIAILAVVAMVSFFRVADYAASPETHRETIEALDEKKATVMKLTGAATGVSVAITMIPGDAATPIAEKLADLSTIFLLVFSAIYLEKYLVTITGYAAFKVLIPLACGAGIVAVLLRSHVAKQLAVKLAVFGLSIVLVIPASVGISNLIEDTYHSSIQNTIDLALETTEEIEEDTELNAAKEEEKKGNIFSELLSTVTETVSIATDKVENVLNHYLEALAVLLVTTCVIPVLVLFFFVWLVKIILGIDIPTPKRDQWEGLRHP